MLCKIRERGRPARIFIVLGKYIQSAISKLIY